MFCLLFLAPSAPPPNATVDDHISTSTLNISWSALPEKFHNGDLSGYRVFYLPKRQAGLDVAGEQEILLKSVDKFTFNILLQDLESYTEYEIHLYAFSRYGDGPPIVLKGGKLLKITFLFIRPLTFECYLFYFISP